MPQPNTPLQRFIRIDYALGARRAALKPVPQAKGRNGRLLMSGMEVYVDVDAGHDGFVQLLPINSRGQVSNAAFLEVPFERTALEELGKLLLDLAQRAP